MYTYCRSAAIAGALTPVQAESREKKKKKCWDGTIREEAEKRRRSVGMVQSEKRQRKEEEVLVWCSQRKGKKKKKCWDGAIREKAEIRRRRSVGMVHGAVRERAEKR